MALFRPEYPHPIEGMEDAWYEERQMAKVGAMLMANHWMWFRLAHKAIKK